MMKNPRVFSGKNKTIEILNLVAAWYSESVRVEGIGVRSSELGIFSSLFIFHVFLATRNDDFSVVSEWLRGSSASRFRATSEEK